MTHCDVGVINQLCAATLLCLRGEVKWGNIWLRDRRSTAMTNWWKWTCDRAHGEWSVVTFTFYIIAAKKASEWKMLTAAKTSCWRPIVCPAIIRLPPQVIYHQKMRNWTVSRGSQSLWDKKKNPVRKKKNNMCFLHCRQHVCVALVRITGGCVEAEDSARPLDASCTPLRVLPPCPRALCSALLCSAPRAVQRASPLHFSVRTHRELACVCLCVRVCVYACCWRSCWHRQHQVANCPRPTDLRWSRTPFFFFLFWGGKTTELFFFFAMRWTYQYLKWGVISFSFFGFVWMNIWHRAHWRNFSCGFLFLFFFFF